MLSVGPSWLVPGCVRRCRCSLSGRIVAEDELNLYMHQLEIELTGLDSAQSR